MAERQTGHREAHRERACHTDLERKAAVHGALCSLRVGPVLPTDSDLTPVI